jgi:cation:H+ antiporter
MWEVLGFFALGLLLVTLGADALVKGASGLAQKRGAGAAAAGLALVAVGSSVPEIAISAAAIVQGHYAMALGNVIGSCIANFGLIIGVAALVKPLSVGFRLVGLGLPLLVIAAIGLLGMSHNGTLGYYDGAVLLAGVIAFGWAIRRSAKTESEAVRKELAYAGNTQTELGRNLARVLVGLGLLGYGAWMSADRAFELAGLWQMSELWAGLTLLAIGSAIPELGAAVVAANRGHGNIVVGSAVSSSVVNVLLVLGLLALWHPLPIAHSLVWVEIPALLAFSLAFYPMIRGDAQVSRREGAILLVAFAAWMAFQLMAGRL